MSACHEVTFQSKAYGFSMIHDGYSNNAVIMTVTNPTHKKSLQVGSWIVGINGNNVEGMKLEGILQLLQTADTPISIKFRAYSLISCTHQELLSHDFTSNIKMTLSDTGNQPAQQGNSKPFIAYNLSITDGPYKWQLWKRYSQFEQLHKQVQCTKHFHFVHIHFPYLYLCNINIYTNI